MRLSRLLKLSFVGTLLFSPSMAQEASQVHAEALKVLRSGGDTNQPAARSVAPAARGNVESRAERQERLKNEARQRLAERDRLQAERRRQFDEYVKERERLRSGAAPGSVHDKALETLRKQEANPAAASTTSVTPAPASTPAAPAPAVQPAPRTAPAAPVVQPAPAAQPAAQPSNDEVQQRALEILRQQREQSAAPTTVPVRESEVAPRTIATPTAAPAAVRPAPGAPGGNNADTHQKALEVLRQQTHAPAAAAVPSSVAPSNVAPTDELKPSPDLQRRLDEMKRELDTPQPRSSVNSVDPAYTRELEQRALEMMQQQRSTPATATAPAPSTPPPSTTTARTPAPRTPASATAATTPAPVPAPSVRSTATTQTTPRRSGALDPAAESRAREILRQQQQAVSSASAATSASVPASNPVPQPATTAQPQAVTPAQTITAAPAPAPARVSTASASGDVNYSQELENRARQALIERSQPQPTTANAEAQAAQAAAANAAGGISTTPVGPDPKLNSVHSRAIETLVQVQPGEGGQTEFKSKRDRLRALTDLYKADRLTPAEYHQRRAKILAEPNE